MPRRDGTGPMGDGAMTGRGLGYACRRGFGCGFGKAYAVDQTYSKTEKELLNEQKEILQERLEAINKQLEDQ